MNIARYKKWTAFALALVMLVSLLPMASGASASTAAEVDYTIISPYAKVNWSTWKQYKANFHTHSIVSDGRADFNEMIERHYELGYDFLAMTDHGTVDRGWVVVNTNPFITFAMNIDTGGAKPTGLSLDRYTAIRMGIGRGGNGMLRVPYGIEHNAAAFNNTHVNSFFADYGDGYLGGTSYYDHILKGVEDAGGVSVLNHPGEYTGARKDTFEDAYNPANLRYGYMINKFTMLFRNYESCLVMEIINKNDSRTKNDRKFWDILLANVVPTGRNIYGFGNSDAHSLDAIDTNWNIMLMPQKTELHLRTSMETGAFFAGSRNIQNPVQLAQLEKETGLTLGTSWTAPQGTPQPKVTNITVNQTTDVISITATNHKTIHWIADGKVIHVGGTIDLDNYSDKIGSYVRAEIWGEGGILYSQPFMLDYNSAPTASTFAFFDFGYILHIVERAFYIVVENSRVLSLLQMLALGTD